MKKLISIVLLSLILISTASCSSGNTGSDTSTTDGTTNTSEGGTNDSKSDGGGGAEKITVWAWDAVFNVAAFDDAKTIFQKENPNVEIEIVEISQDDTIKKLNTILASGTTNGLPNTLPIEDYRIQTFLQAYPGAIKEMTDSVDYTKFASYKQASMTHEGKLYGIPWDTGAAVMYYRLDYIEEAGYTEADMENITWEKYIEIGRAVKEKTGKYLIEINPDGTAFLRTNLQSAGVWISKEDGSGYFKDNEALEESLGYYKTLVEEELAFPSSGWAEMVAGFNDGSIASTITGCWFTPSITAADDQSGNWRVTNVPKLNVSGATSYSNLGGSSIYVLDGMDATDITQDFVVSTFGGNEEFYENLLSKRGILGTFLPTLESDAYQAEVEFFGNQKIYSIMGNVTENIPAVNYGKNTYLLDDVLKAQLPTYLAGTDAAATLESAQQQADSQIR